MTQYIGLLQTSNGVLWVANPNDNDPRLFDDEKEAERIAKIFGFPYAVITKEKFDIMLTSENGDDNVRKTSE